MQKIRQKYLNRMIQSDLTGNEVNFILYLSRYQDNYGHVVGVYYKDACENLHISIQGFYDILRSLTEKKLISWEKKHYQDIDVQLIDNDFSDYDYHNIKKNDGYINTNFNLFYNAAFLSLKGPEKLLAMDWLKNYLAGKRSYSIKVSSLIEKYTKLLKIKRKTLIRYIRMLKLFFSIGIKDGVYYITPLSNYRRKTDKCETDVYEQYQDHVGIRRNRIINRTDNEMKNMLSLFKQYSPEIREKHDFDFSEVVFNTLAAMNQAVDCIYKWNRKLNIPLLHKELRAYLNI